MRSGDDRQVCHRLLQRLALARRAIIGIYFPPIPWPMTLSPTTKVIRVKSRGKKPLVLGKKLPTGWEAKYKMQDVVKMMVKARLESKKSNPIGNFC